MIIIISLTPQVYANSFSDENNYLNSIPRNLPRSIIWENNTVDNSSIGEIPIELTPIIQRLEKMKEIIEKYNSTIASKITNIELKIATGDYDEAAYDYQKLKKDIEEILSEIEQTDTEDYLNLLTIIPNDLNNYVSYYQSGDVQKLFQSELRQDLEITLPKLNTKMVTENLFNPPIFTPTLAFPNMMNLTSQTTIMISLIMVTIVSLYIIIKKNVLLNKVLKTSKKVFYKIGEKIEEITYREHIKTDNHITRNYYIFLKKMKKMGYEKNIHEAPLEFAKRFKEDDLKEMGIKLGILFEKIRYGLKEPKKEEIIESDRLISKIIELVEEKR